MATIPVAGVKPEGFVEDPENPDYIGYQLVITASVCMALSTLFVGLRLYTRFFIRRFFGLDDTLIIIAWICGTTLGISDIVQCKYGTGTHLWDLPIPTFETFLKLQMVVGNFYTAALPFAKISICVFYLRISADTKFQFVVKMIIGFVAAYATSGVMVIIFSCSPVSASWDLTVAAAPGTTCVNRPMNYLAQASLNIASDLAIILVPQYTIYKLQMPLKQRITLMCIFAGGLFVTIVSIVRLQSLVILLNSNDLTWDTTAVLIWSTLEAHVTIICACAPTLKPLVSYFMPNWLRSKNTSRGRTTYASQSLGRPQKIPDEGVPRIHSESYELGKRGSGNGTVTDVEVGRFAKSPLSESQESILESNQSGVYVTKTVNVY